MPNTTWNAADLSATTLSGGNLTATSTGTAGYVRATGTQPASGAGKFYWEVKPTTWAGANSSVGFCSSLRSAPSGAAPVEACLIYKSGNIWTNNVATGVTLGARATNDVIGIALDLGAQLVWFRVAPAGNWNGNAGFAPGGTGGISVANVASYDASPIVAWGASADVAVGSFGDNAFIGTVPGGFTSGVPVGSLPARTNTLWNPADRTASVILSGGNLTASLIANSQGIRAVNSQVTGKYYFEVTATTWTGGLQPFIGIANASATLSSIGSTPTNACGVVQSGGSIYMNGIVAPGSPAIGTRANGDIIGIAVDLPSTLAWFRVAPSGNWNGNGGFAPGGTGGVNFSAIGGGATAVYPVLSGAFSPTLFTANFGDGAFSGSVPSGYTPGWTVAAGGAVAGAQARALVLA